jgi:competence protein ComEC
MASAAVAAAGGAVLLAVRRFGARALAACAAALTILTGGWRLWPEPGWPPVPSPGLRITALDVGQGDAILLQTAGAAVLVDQGPPEADVSGQLRKLGVDRLSLLVLTHPQRDHVGGAADVLRKQEVGTVLDPQILAPSPDYAAALRAARERRVRILPAARGMSFRLGRLHLRVLWPPRPGMKVADPNDAATVLHATYGQTDVLLTADAESNVTLRVPLPEAEVLKVAHHGSADEGLDSLLERVRPRLALISVGAGNDYGHPAPSTVRALAAARGLTTYRTDRDGRVSIDTDGRGLWVVAEHE